MLYQSLPPTQFDLNFTIAGFPVRVHPMFWLIGLLLGFNSNLITVLIWVFVIFVSILVHELGHAFAFRFYGIHSRIFLHAMGGLAIPEPAPWGGGYAEVSPTPRQQIIISFAGPMAGFMLALLVILFVIFTGGSVGFSRVIPLPVVPQLPWAGYYMTAFVGLMLWVNVFWGVINLLPVFPLDGGQISRSIFIQVDPMDGVRKSLWLSVATGVFVALLALVLLSSFYMAILFGLLAFQSYTAVSGRYYQ